MKKYLDRSEITAPTTLPQRLGERALETGYPKAALYEEAAGRIMELEAETARLRTEIVNLNRGMARVRAAGLKWQREASNHVRDANREKLLTEALKHVR